MIKLLNKGLVGVLAGVAGLPLARTAAAQESAASAVEEVVVTARRREESLQDVPISIQAFTAEELELRGIEAGADLSTMIPNFMAGHESANISESTLAMRGIPDVGVYVDGVWQGPIGFMEESILEMTRVEVMRGPQGTLFGRNTNGGAIQYVTREPAEEFDVRVDLALGEYGRRDIAGSVDFPLSDNVLTKVTAAVQESDGWMRSIARPDRAYGGRDDTMLRGDLLWRATDHFQARLTASTRDTRKTQARQVRWSTQGLPPGLTEHVRQTVYNIAALNPDYGPYDFWPGPLPNFGLPIKEFTAHSHQAGYPGGQLGQWETRSDAPLDGQVFDVEQYTLTMDWDLGENLSLRSLTAYRDQLTRVVSDFLGAEITMVTDLRMYEDELFSEELHLTGTFMDGRLGFLAGIYYADSTAKRRQYRWGMHEFFEPGPDGQPVPNMDMVSFVRAWGAAHNAPLIAAWTPRDFYDGDEEFTVDEKQDLAVFGEVNYSPTDRLDLTFGARWTGDDGRSLLLQPTGAFRLYDPPELSGTGYGPGDVFGGIVLEEEDFESGGTVFTPKVSLAYHLTDDIMTFVSYAEGFTRGEVNYVPELDRQITLDPEVVESHEIGLRSEWLDGRLRANVTAFLANWNGLRVTQQFLIGPVNAQDFVNLTVSAGKAEAKGVESEIRFRPNPAWELNAALAVLDTKYIDVGDPELSPLRPGAAWAYAPDFSASLGLQYNLDIANGAEITFRGDYGYMTEYQRSASAQRQNPEPEPAYGVLNARIRYTNPSGDMTIALFGTNLTNEYYVTSGIDAGQLWGLDFIQPGPPRQVGVSLSFRL